GGLGRSRDGAAASDPPATGRGPAAGPPGRRDRAPAARAGSRGASAPTTTSAAARSGTRWRRSRRTMPAAIRCPGGSAGPRARRLAGGVLLDVCQDRRTRHLARFRAGAPAHLLELAAVLVDRDHELGVAPGQGRDRERGPGVRVDLLREQAARELVLHRPVDDLAGLLQVGLALRDRYVPLGQPERADEPGVAGHQADVRLDLEVVVVQVARHAAGLSLAPE